MTPEEAQAVLDQCHEELKALLIHHGVRLEAYVDTDGDSPHCGMECAELIIDVDGEEISKTVYPE